MKELHRHENRSPTLSHMVKPRFIAHPFYSASAISLLPKASTNAQIVSYAFETCMLLMLYENKT